MHTLEEILPQLTIGENVCACEKCNAMCDKRACWPTPEEAVAIIDAGYGDQLMLDWWNGDHFDEAYDRILILCPGETGSVGQRSDREYWMFFQSGGGPCSMHRDDLCFLHDLGLKPLEGRYSRHGLPTDEDSPYMKLHEAMAESWNNPEAQRLARDWATQRGIEL